MRSAASSLKSDLKLLSDPNRANTSARFFKTGKGEYGEGDRFWGITVPDTRKVARKHEDLREKDLAKLLIDPVHEVRLAALLVLVHQYQSAKDDAERKRIFGFYMSHSSKVNNWDLVDLSADKIAGAYLADRPGERMILCKLARSSNLWRRRIAMIATYEFIRQHDFKDTIKLAEMLLNDKHDLMHKAAGWMLREVGKRNSKELEQFLDKHAARMPRTMLRYAIERLPKTKRAYYMKIQ